MQSLAFAQLQYLSQKIDKALQPKLKLDDYSRAHLAESQARIKKVLDAKLTTTRP